MKKFNRDLKIARILSAVGVGVTTYNLMCLTTPGLPHWSRLVLAVLGFAGLLCSIIGWRRVGFMAGFDSTIDNLLERNLIDMERYERILQLRRAADQRDTEEEEQDIRRNGG